MRSCEGCVMYVLRFFKKKPLQKPVGAYRVRRQVLHCTQKSDCRVIMCLAVTVFASVQCSVSVNRNFYNLARITKSTKAQ